MVKPDATPTVTVQVHVKHKMTSYESLYVDISALFDHGWGVKIIKLLYIICEQALRKGKSLS